jgi:hypothetical protein
MRSLAGWLHPLLILGHCTAEMVHLQGSIGEKIELRFPSDTAAEAFYAAAEAFDVAKDPLRLIGSQNLSDMPETACHTSDSYWDSVLHEEEKVSFYSAGGKALRVLVLGDSRVDFFARTNHVLQSRAFDTCLVRDASASGITDLNSKTRALDMFRQKLESVSSAEYDAVVVMIGAVDLACGIWRRAARFGTPVEEQMQLSADNLFGFVEEVSAVFPPERIVVVGPESPGSDSSVELYEYWNSVDEQHPSMQQRTKMALGFSRLLRAMSNTRGYKYFDTLDGLEDHQQHVQESSQAKEQESSQAKDALQLGESKLRESKLTSPRVSARVYLTKLQQQIELMAEAERERGGDLIGWLRRRGAVLPQGLQVHRFDDGVVGLQVGAVLEPGAVVMRIPTQACLSIASALRSDIGPIFRDLQRLHPSMHDDTLLAIHLVRERVRGEASEFFPYIKLLPSALANGWHLSDADLALLGDVEADVERRDRLRVLQLSQQLDTAVFQPNREFFAHPYLSAAELFRWAYQILESRSWSSMPFDLVPGTRSWDKPFPCLVPAMDMLNHRTGAGRPGPLFVGGVFAEEIAVQATQRYESGSQIFDSYDPLSPDTPHCNVVLLRKFGFTLDEYHRGCINIRWAPSQLPTTTVNHGNDSARDSELWLFQSGQPLPARAINALRANYQVHAEAHVEVHAEVHAPLLPAADEMYQILLTILRAEQVARFGEHPEERLAADLQVLVSVETLLHNGSTEFSKIVSRARRRQLDIARVRVGQQQAMSHAISLTESAVAQQLQRTGPGG